MLDGISFLVVGSYLTVVLYQGNAKPLFVLLKGDIQFVEFAVALALLGVVYKSPALHPIGKSLIFAAFVLLGFRVLKSQSGLVSAVSDVSTGKSDAITALKKLVPAAPPLATLPTISPDHTPQMVGGAGL
jgi:predicted membrane channel-forming protein YqfA (hemolysin III family)